MSYWATAGEGGGPLRGNWTFIALRDLERCGCRQDGCGAEDEIGGIAGI